VELQPLHVDNHLLVVCKPAGLPTVPDSSGDESLLERAKAWIRREYEKPGAVFLGVVQRLDRPVSGVLCFARTSKAARRLSAAFAAREVEKTYWAVLPAAPREGEGRVEQWLVKDRQKNRVRVVAEGSAGAQRALTRWRVIEELAGRCLVELSPETGRPHQLRAAMAGIGRPLLGDLKYGAEAPLDDRSVALHAFALALEHPTRKEWLRFISPPPATQPWDFAACARVRRLGPA